MFTGPSDSGIKFIRVLDGEIYDVAANLYSMPKSRCMDLTTTTTADTTPYFPQSIRVMDQVTVGTLTIQSQYMNRDCIRFPGFQKSQTRQHVDIFLFSCLFTWKDKIFIVFIVTLRIAYCPHPPGGV